MKMAKYLHQKRFYTGYVIKRQNMYKKKKKITICVRTTFMEFRYFKVQRA